MDSNATTKERIANDFEASVRGIKTEHPDLPLEALAVLQAATKTLRQMANSNIIPESSGTESVMGRICASAIVLSGTIHGAMTFRPDPSKLH